MRRLRTLASATALALVASGCTILGVTGPGKDQSSGPADASSTAPGGATSASPSTTVDPNNLPVAHYDPKAHEVFPDAPKAPDRTKLTSEATPKGFAKAPDGKGLDRYLDQKITWTECEEFQCGTVLVPLDWDDPDGQAITLKMKKRSAGKKSKGTIFINPGGPGGSGQDYVESFDPTPFSGYDIIGWDPRGSGESTPVVCASNEKMDQYNAVDMSPDDKAEFDELKKAQVDFASWCRKESGPLLDHISTIDNVRDLDYLRHLVGDKKLTYMGVSYGTLIGSLYAELYPKRAGRLVLDSAVNITDKDSVIQQMGFETALKDFGDWCAAKGRVSCPWGSTGEAVVKNLDAWFTGLDSKPIKDLDQNKAVLGVATYLYGGEQAYTMLQSALLFARTMGQTRFLTLAADQMIGKDEKGNYTAMAFSFPAIACADSTDEGLGKVQANWDEAKKKAPVFGKHMGPGMNCEVWSARPMDQLKITAKGADPILVLGATGDPATPYQQAEWMADQLDSGVLLTWKGAGHGVYALGNSCAKKHVEDYVNEGVVPKDRTTC